MTRLSRTSFVASPGNVLVARFRGVRIGPPPLLAEDYVVETRKRKLACKARGLLLLLPCWCVVLLSGLSTR